MFDEHDFDSPDPFVRYQAHQAAKGNTTALDPDAYDLRDKTDREDEAVDGDG